MLGRSVGRAIRIFAWSLVCASLVGCGDDDEGGGSPPTATPVATATATVAATATASPSATSAPSATPTASSTPSATAPLPTSSPTATVEPGFALARRIEDPDDLIGGPMAMGRVGDFLLANDQIRVVIRDVGRQFSFLLTYGGNIIDADWVRAPGEPGQDNFLAMTPLINISSTANVQEIVVINDGSDGQPAVIRTFGVDDLFDAIDPTNAIREFGFGALPVAAQDVDLPIEITTEYTLEPGERAVRIDTSIRNDGERALPLYVGDFLNGGGELDTFVPSLGFGEPVLRLEMPFMAYAGIGANRSVSYGIIPVPLPGFEFTAGAFTQTGVSAWSLGQDVLSIILSQAPGALVVPAGETRSYTRYFAVGSGDVGSVADVRNRLFSIPVGTLRGQVTAHGAPAAGAIVSVVRKPGEAGAEFDVVDSFRTGADGRYGGTVAPGNYFVLARLEGYPYDSETVRPLEHPVEVVAGQEVEQDIALPATGALRVTVVDQEERPIPARVILIGFDPNPDPGNLQDVAGFLLRGFVFDSNPKRRNEFPFGIAGLHFVGPSGDTGVVPVPPGEYEAVITHGPEFSEHRQRLVIASGETTTVNAILARVVDTGGFVGADYHVHLVQSPDSYVTRDERILAMMAEGMEHMAASDHDFRTDLTPDIARLGVADDFASSVSDEITTFDFGHFNVWPLPVDPSSITGGALDWGRSGVAPGMDYPSLGSYDLSPAEIFAASPEDSVVQVNHMNTGFFSLAGIDTAQVPPQSFTDPTRIRQDPSITNLYDDGYTTLEVWIEGNRSQTARFREANLGDWFNLLNQGRFKSATADSDTHTTLLSQAGGPRNFVAASTDTPGDLDEAELAASVTGGRLIGTNAPFVRIQVEGEEGQTAGLALGEPQLVRATSGQVTVRLGIQSPLWAEFDTVEIYANTVPLPVPDRNFHGVTVPRYSATPNLVLRAGTDFEVATVTVDPELPGAARLQADLEIPLVFERDTWIVVLISGTDGVSRPLWPYSPEELASDGNGSLDDLTDGNLGEGGNLSLAFTNPLYVDVDGNGQFDPPFELP